MYQLLQCAKRLFLTVACMAFIGMPAGVSAEWFGDLYGGMVVSGLANSTFVQHVPQEQTVPTKNRTAASPTFGVRAGYWFAKPYSEKGESTLGHFLGIAGDISYFAQKTDRSRFDLVPISVLLMVRIPLLKSDEFPAGRLQPYAGVGPSLMFANSSIDSPGQGINGVSNFEAAIALDVRAGIAWQAHKVFKIFAEYRLTNANLIDRSYICTNPQGCGHRTNTESTLTDETRTMLLAHHVLVGFRF